MKGKIIVIEGTDGSGKQTQAKMLFDALQAKGIKVLTTSFPNYESPSSGPVKMYLGGELSETANEIDAYQASSLFAVDRFCTMKKFEKPLKEGWNLVLDRYIDSNSIHQETKIKTKKERIAYENWAYKFEYDKLKIPKANMVIFLNVPPEVSLKLIEQRNELKNGQTKDIQEQDKKHIYKAHKIGLEVAKRRNWKVIDCTKDGKMLSRDEIHHKVLKAVQKEFKTKNSNELNK